jgi:hypothetical protein
MNKIFSPNLDLMVSCPSNDPDHASDGITPRNSSPAAEKRLADRSKSALRRWFADLQLGKAFGGREECLCHRRPGRSRNLALILRVLRHKCAAPKAKS